MVRFLIDRLLLFLVLCVGRASVCVCGTGAQSSSWLHARNSVNGDMCWMIWKW